MHKRDMHDLGGLDLDDPINQEEHPKTWFDKRVNALLRQLSHPDNKLMGSDELRRGIESLAPEQYESYSYYERWINAIRLILTEKGVVDEAELLQRMAQIKDRLAREENP